MCIQYYINYLSIALLVSKAKKVSFFYFLTKYFFLWACQCQGSERQNKIPGKWIWKCMHFRTEKERKSNFAFRIHKIVFSAFLWWLLHVFALLYAPLKNWSFGSIQSLFMTCNLGRNQVLFTNCKKGQTKLLT